MKHIHFYCKRQPDLKKKKKKKKKSIYVSAAVA